MERGEEDEEQKINGAAAVPAPKRLELDAAGREAGAGGDWLDRPGIASDCGPGRSRGMKRQMEEDEGRKGTMKPKTIGQYFIKKWLEANFCLSQMKVEYIGPDKAMLTDSSKDTVFAVYRNGEVFLVDAEGDASV